MKYRIHLEVMCVSMMPERYIAGGLNIAVCSPRFLCKQYAIDNAIEAAQHMIMRDGPGVIREHVDLPSDPWNEVVIVEVEA